MIKVDDDWCLKHQRHDRGEWLIYHTVCNTKINWSKCESCWTQISKETYQKAKFMSGDRLAHSPYDDGLWKEKQ